MTAFFLNLNKYCYSAKYNVFEYQIFKRNLELLEQKGFRVFQFDENSDIVKDAMAILRNDEKLSKNFDKLIELGFYNFASNILRAIILSASDELLYLDYDTMLRDYSLDCILSEPEKMRFDSYEYDGKVTAQLNIMYSGKGYSKFFNSMIDVYRGLEIKSLRDAYDEDVVIKTQELSGIYLNLSDRIMVTHLCIGKNFRYPNLRVIITDKTGPEVLNKVKLQKDEALLILSSAIYDPAWVWDSRPYSYFMFEIPSYYYKPEFFHGLFWQVTNKIVDNTTYLPEGSVEVRNVYFTPWRENE